MNRGNKSVKSKGEKVAENLTDFINSATYVDRKEFVRTLVGEHRTLQEEVFKLFLEASKEWATMYEDGNYDPRNEFTVKTSKKVVDILDCGWGV